MMRPRLALVATLCLGSLAACSQPSTRVGGSAGNPAQQQPPPWTVHPTTSTLPPTTTTTVTSKDSYIAPSTIETTSPRAAAAQAADLLGEWTMTDWTTPAGRRPVQFDATVRFTANGDGTGTLKTSGCETATYDITFADAQSFVIGAFIGDASSCANPFDEGQRLGGIFIPNNECRGTHPVTLWS